MPREGRRTWKNWSRKHQCRPARWVEPVELHELVAAVRDAGGAGRKIRAVGGSHSWSALVPTDDCLISLDGMNRILHVDRHKRQVRVEAGIRLWELNEALAQEGLALSNLGSIDRQSVAGVVSTATHGTGLAYPILSKQVVEMELVTADGHLWRCSADEGAEFLPAVLCGLGALGIISSLTLQCTDAFNVESIEEKWPFERVVSELDTLVAQNDHFKFWWLPYAGECVVFRQNRTLAPKRRNRFRTWLDQRLLRNPVLDLGLALSTRIPGSLAAFQKGLLAATPSRARYVDRSDRVFCFPVDVRHWEGEYAIDYRDAKEVLTRLSEIFLEGRVLVTMPIEVRFVAADDVWLSPAYGRPSCYLGFLQYRTIPIEPYLGEVERVLAAYGARPHWGKTHLLSAADLEPRYPNWSRFLEVRDRLDPRRTFTTPFLERLLDVK